MGRIITQALALALGVLSVDATTPKTMRAVVVTGHGNLTDFSNVKLVTDRPVPQPRHRQVLIRVVASSVEPVDMKFYEGVYPMWFPKVFGFNVAGVIAEVGAGCKRLKVGDEVWADLGKGLGSIFGPQLGAWADYAVAQEDQVGLKPARMSFVDAASLPVVALTALQVFREVGLPRVQGSGELTVVVVSGAGGTGTTAIQMAKMYGATRIITASSPSNFELLKSLGATDVIDYHKGTIWDALPENSVDVVYDNYGAGGTADAAMMSIKPGGAFVFLPGKDGALSKHPKEGVKQLNFGVVDASSHTDLDATRALVDKGLKAVVQQTFALEDIVQALKSISGGHVVGKLGIAVATADEIVVV